MGLRNNLKQWWNGYLERMAEANERSFGSQRLDCCVLNQTPEPRRTPRNSSSNFMNQEKETQ